VRSISTAYPARVIPSRPPGATLEAERLLRMGLQRAVEARHFLFYGFFQGELAAALYAAGRIEEGLVEINAALNLAEKSDSMWCMPELLRVKGELTQAEEWFVQSLVLHAGKRRCRGSCGRRSAWRAFGKCVASVTTRSHCLRMSTESSLKASTRPICGRRESCFRV
jgi:hypothetical protein